MIVAGFLNEIRTRAPFILPLVGVSLLLTVVCVWMTSAITPALIIHTGLVGCTAALLLQLGRTERASLVSEDVAVLRNIIENIPHRVFWKDRRSVYLGANRRFAADAGLDSPDQLVGLSDDDLVWAEQAELFQSDDRATMDNGVPLINFEEPQDRPDGSRAVLLTSKVPLRRANGEVFGILGMYIDITERKQMEEALREAVQQASQASQAKSTFLANTSHEIRTPLNGVLGMLDLVLDEPLPDEVRGRLRVAQRSAQGLLDIINDILDISKIESGKVTIRPQAVDLPEMLQELQQTFSPLAAGQNITLRARLDSPIPARIITDPVRLKQCLINLLGNAIKFTDQGTVTLRARTQAGESGEEWLLLSVQDTGLGIPPERLELIFESFEQAHGALSARSGTGLGLSICRRLVTLMGGEITVISAVDQGSTFTIRLPCATPDSVERITALSAAARPQRVEIPSLRGRVLLAEDNEINIQVARAMIEKTGIKVDVARDGRAALEAIQKAPARYALLLTDIHMPEMNGLQLVETLRAEGFTLPIVILSASVMSDDIRRSMEAGCDAHLAKPIVRPTLYALLARHFPAAANAS